MSRQRLWGVTAFFNPAGYASRLINYRLFRSRLPIPLVTAELSFDGRFELDHRDADILLRYGDGDVMWQKERLLNLAIAQLPGECDQVVVLDCDVIFPDPDWREKVERLLEAHPAAQPFRRCHRLMPYQLPGRSPPRIETSSLSFAESLAQGEPMRGATGYAWAYRRDLLERQGLYDRCIIGGADRLMALAGAALLSQAVGWIRLNDTQARHFLAWAGPFSESVRGDVGSADSDAFVLWHGFLGHRLYLRRHEAFQRFAFDPCADLREGAEGCWRWSTAKPRMHQFVRDYFAARQEDGLLRRAPDGRVVLVVA